LVVALRKLAGNSPQHRPLSPGLRVFPENDWVGDIGHGQTTISVLVKNPEVEHKVRMLDFDQWLASGSRSPAEMNLKQRVRELLSKRISFKCADAFPLPGENW
jgi:hypothetical protein